MSTSEGPAAAVRAQARVAEAARGRPSLPHEPLIRIRPEQKWLGVRPREVWAYRELLYLLMWRDLKARYKQTALGAAWVVLQPVLSTLIFTVFMGTFIRVPSDGVPYPVFAYAGLLPWAFLSNSVLSGSHSIVASAHVINKVYFPRLLIPVSMVGVRLIDFVIASAVLIVLMAYYGIALTPGILLAPLLIAEVAALAVSLSILTSAVNARYRDTGTALPVLLQLWMFASPVIYPSTVVPARWRWAYDLNPLAGIIEGLRACLFGRPLDWRAVALSAALTLALLLCSVYVFRRMEEDFADMV